MFPAEKGSSGEAAFTISVFQEYAGEEFCDIIACDKSHTLLRDSLIALLNDKIISRFGR